MGGRPAPFTPVEFYPPVDELNDDFPLRLTTGRRLDSFNTGVQTGGYASPLRAGETLDLAPSDGARYDVTEGERVRISSRRGSVEAPVRFDENLRPGLAFLTVHFPDEVDTNQLTIEAWDPKSGTSEFKATAIRIGKARNNDGERALRMDLHWIDATATEGERSAVDAVLGSQERPDVPGASIEEHIARAGRELVEDKRHLLLPALHGVQERIGWISKGALNYICGRLLVPPAEAYGVASFYAMFSTEPRPKQVAHLCDDIACKLQGTDALCSELESSLDTDAWHRSPCLGQCERGPAVLFQLAGRRRLGPDGGDRERRGGRAERAK